MRGGGFISLRGDPRGCPCLRGTPGTRFIYGILVTTSHYGPDSIDFIKDKSITLINGSELVSMLKEHGYEYFVDVEEARKIL